jgi:hypothetical protein
VFVKLPFRLNSDSVTPPYQSRNYGQLGTGKTVGFVVPPQAGVTGPTTLAWGGPDPFSKLTVTAAGKQGKPQQLVLRGTRPTHCGQFQMNNAVLCGDGREESILGLRIFEEDNKGIVPGEYSGRVKIEARGWHDKDFVEDLVIDYIVIVEAEKPPPPQPTVEPLPPPVVEVPPPPPRVETLPPPVVDAPPKQ